MAETKMEEREYVVPLRRHWLNVPRYERTRKAIKAIKNFVAKHMKVTDRDIDKVKLDVYLNNDLWFRGRASPPSRVKVKVRRDGELVHVSFAETPKHVTFLQAKHAKIHVKAEKKTAPTAEAPKTEQSAEQKTEEKEKEKAVAVAKMKDAEMDAKAQKNVTKAEKAQRPQRMALKK